MTSSDTPAGRPRLAKAHREFHTVDLDDGWQVPPGYPSSIEQKTLADAFDPVTRRGSRTRLVRFHPGAFTTEPFTHDHWEEVYLLSGDLIVGSDPDGTGGEPFPAHTYACRPPGVAHGPFRSETGCLMLELHYYDPA